jgi:serine/threonine protein kinase
VSKYPIPFGRHLLLERINVGGMAEVFRAKSFGVEGFERIVAVKRILPTLADDEEFITMFIDEARIAAHLTHQNIVQIFELNRAEKTFFISMEYVAGHDLRLILDHQKKQRRPMEVPKAAFIVSRVAEALEYAHRKRDPAGRDLKIIHRDVTPQNVIVSFEGEVKLCDFGIAKAATRVSRTQVGVLKGKFAYMSPEQVRGQPTDRRSDIFALGVIFYEMLTGERLFLGESDYATLDSVRQAVIPPPSKYNPNLSPGLEAVLLKMLARDPKDRYQWAAEVHEDLLDHLIHDGKRPYHGRHLRAWMQETYARDVEVENAKLEEFVRLRMPAGLETSDDEPAPRPAQAVAELAEKSVAADPADLPRHDEEFQDATDAIPAVSAKSRSPAPKGVVSSPVASLYGAAELASVSEEGSPGRLVMPSGPYEEARAPRKPSHPTTRLDTEEGPVEEPSADAERTQYDMVLQPGLVASGEGPYDPEVNDTVIGGDELEGEISAAQAELIAQLDRAGALDTGDTVDASDESFADGRLPEIGELSDGQTLQGDEDEPMNEDTPLGIAPTFVRDGSGPGFEPEATAEGRGRGESDREAEAQRPVGDRPGRPDPRPAQRRPEPPDRRQRLGGRTLCRPGPAPAGPRRLGSAPPRPCPRTSGPPTSLPTSRAPPTRWRRLGSSPPPLPRPARPAARVW